MASSIPKSEEPEPTGRGVLSCFVNNGGTVYAVVCKHVSRTAREGFFIRDKHGMKIPFASKKKRRTSANETYTDFDIDIVKVDDNKKYLCYSTFTNKDGNTHADVRIYNGTTEQLHDKNVFMRTQEGKTKHGKIIPTDSVRIPDFIRDSYDSSRHFFAVAKDDDTVFADEGDSGRLVVRENDDHLELLGIVVHDNESCTICLLLKDGLDKINEERNLNLNLYQSSMDGASEDMVKPGDTLFFHV